ncbi:MAG: hypothetical protein LBH03_06735, partial [Holophagales bacterium]|nr:hypothetical protein [Holophagales bacterium]
QTGRGLVKRNEPANTSGTQRNIYNRPFEDQSSRRALEERPILRDSLRRSEPQPDGGRTTGSNRENTSGTPDNRRNVIFRDTSRNPDTPSRRLDMREVRRSEPGQERSRQNNTPPSGSSSNSRESGQTITQPSRSVEKREAPKTEQQGSSRAIGRPAAPAPSSPARTAAPPPDRSRNSRR